MTLFMCSITIRELCLADRHNLFYNSAFLRIRNKDGRAGLSVLCLPQTDSILQSLHRDALPPKWTQPGCSLVMQGAYWRHPLPAWRPYCSWGPIPYLWLVCRLLRWHWGNVGPILPILWFLFFRLRIRRFLYGRVQINVWGSALALTTDRFCLHVLQRERFQSMFLGSSHRLTAPGWKYCLYSFRKGRGNLTGWGNLSDWAYGHSAEKGVLLCIYFMFPPYQFLQFPPVLLDVGCFYACQTKTPAKKTAAECGLESGYGIKFSSFKSLYSHPKPINPACSPLKSAPRKITLSGTFSNKGENVSMLSTMIWCWAYCVANEWMTGIAIATLLMDEKQITRILDITAVLLNVQIYAKFSNQPIIIR